MWGMIKKKEKGGRETKAPEAKTSGAQKRFCPASLDSIIRGGKCVNTFFPASKDFSSWQGIVEDGSKNARPQDPGSHMFSITE